MTASKRNIHGHGYPGLLYDKQVNGAGAWRTEQFIKPFLAVTPKIGREGGKKKRKREAFSCFPNLWLLKAALSWLDVGPAYYEDPVWKTVFP
ncbi:hypothetical protein POTOM_060192 (mitochondrion) [Populus tomentosa]|uniref:Uncharacterized protein n=1 Tax=Populus tomentosa TaxID=118781 RepID=A0A8X8BVZ7_POPTO|nr:hypothetical protein POTOM_060192 [Populus tomentosa]